MPTISLEGDISLLSKAVLYTNILKKIVQDKRPSVTASAQKTCINGRGHGKYYLPAVLSMLKDLSPSVLTIA